MPSIFLDFDKNSFNSIPFSGWLFTFHFLSRTWTFTTYPNDPTSTVNSPDSTEDELNKLMMEYELIMVGVGYSKFTYMPPSTRMLAPVT